MKFHKRPVLRVLSAIFADIASGFYLSLVAIRDPDVLTENFLFGSICMLIAIKIEQLLEYD